MRFKIGDYARLVRSNIITKRDKAVYGNDYHNGEIAIVLKIHENGEFDLQGYGDGKDDDYRITIPMKYYDKLTRKELIIEMI